jgi:hypothetical protein
MYWCFEIITESWPIIYYAIKYVPSLLIGVGLYKDKASIMLFTLVNANLCTKRLHFYSISVFVMNPWAVREQLFKHRNTLVNCTARNCTTACKRLNWIKLLKHRLKVKTSTLFLKCEIQVLGKTNRLISLIRHGPYWKWHVQQFFYCSVCIRYRVNVSTEPLPSNDTGIFSEPLPSNDRGDTHTDSNEIS